jgi:LacI family transcriptional regulator
MIVSSRMREHEMAWMTEIDKPLVFFGSLAELPLPIVASDDHAGAYMLAQHLRMLGHRRIAYLGCSDEMAGQGRFDRYSILLAAETCECFMETGLSA